MWYYVWMGIHAFETSISWILLKNYSGVFFASFVLTELSSRHAKYDASRSSCSVFCLYFWLTKLWNILRDGTCGGAVGWGTALQVGRSRVRFRMESVECFVDVILPPALWPWGRLSFYQKWVPGISLGRKGGRCVGLTTLSPSCADCIESLRVSTSWRTCNCMILHLRGTATCVTMLQETCVRRNMVWNRSALLCRGRGPVS